MTTSGPIRKQMQTGARHQKQQFVLFSSGEKPPSRSRRVFAYFTEKMALSS